MGADPHAPPIEWDPVRDQANRAKHGIGLADAVKVFHGPTISFTDPRAVGEDRVVSIGEADGRILVVVHVDRQGGAKRVISARPANSQERAGYQRLLG